MNNDKLELRSLNLNTQFKSSGLIGNPSFVLAEQMKDIRAVKLKNCMIPLSFYTIDSRNNKIYIDINNSGTTLTATIPNGIYTSSTLPAAIKIALDALSARTFTVTYVALTNKISFTIDSTVFKFMAGDFNMYYELGITNDDLNSPALSIIPSEVIDLSGVKCIHLISNISAIKVAGQNYSILGSVICEESQNDISTFNDDSSDYVIANISSLSEISINLYDSRFRRLTPLKDYSITINFLTE